MANKSEVHASISKVTDSSTDDETGIDNESRSQSTHNEGSTSRTSIRRSLRVVSPNVRYSKDYVTTNRLTKQQRDGNNIVDSTDETDEETVQPRTVGNVDNVRRSLRITSPNVRYSKDYVTEQRTPKRREAKAESSTDNNSGSEDDSWPASESGDEDSLEMLNNKVAATTLFEAQKDVPGTGIYGFQTPKKRGLMSALAQACSATRTPRADPKTPTHLRKMNKKDLRKALQAYVEGEFSASESDYAPSDEEDESGTDDGENEDEEEEEDEVSDSSVDGHSDKGRKSTTARNIVPPTPKAPVPASIPQASASAGQTLAGSRATRSTVNRASAGTQYFVESDNYFSSHTSAKSATSDHTLDRLSTPRLAQDVLQRLLQDTNASNLHTAAIQDMLAEHEQQFERWMFLLNEGFSVLLYGLGSKRSLLQTFHHKLLADRSVVVVNGFFPSLTVKDVLDAVANELLELQLQTTLLHHETIDEIKLELALQPDRHIFLLVHNLDGAAMRNGRMQSTLCRLASIPNVHLIATIDHINAPLLWDASKLGLYNFCWWDVTTMLPYSVETAFENSLLVQGGGALALSSMGSVFASLTSNARGIFMVIVKYQLANSGPSNPNYAGMQFKDLYWSCREAFYVSSDIALRAQLTEFTDHKLLRIKRSLDGSEYLTIPIEHGLLKKFVDEAAKKL
ncbi:origin recognition complex subunit 2 [Anopheles maculipalpis]|uniref:origin recognition complex subunit 2 n=1 Tax=Anopheles maculipalpis TaxID=1496333 RepID=UPI002158D554|nr:origin recognition complex subunit 2 [Anopheles maculipalpis]